MFNVNFCFVSCTRPTNNMPSAPRVADQLMVSTLLQETCHRAKGANINEEHTHHLRNYKMMNQSWRAGTSQCFLSSFFARKEPTSYCCRCSSDASAHRLNKPRVILSCSLGRPTKEQQASHQQQHHRLRVVAQEDDPPLMQVQYSTGSSSPRRTSDFTKETDALRSFESELDRAA